jgi:hypothetical protein
VPKLQKPNILKRDPKPRHQRYRLYIQKSGDSGLEALEQDGVVFEVFADDALDMMAKLEYLRRTFKQETGGELVVDTHMLRRAIEMGRVKVKNRMMSVGVPASNRYGFVCVALVDWSDK